jgi:hypothetical protein
VWQCGHFEWSDDWDRSIFDNCRRMYKKKKKKKKKIIWFRPVHIVYTKTIFLYEKNTPQNTKKLKKRIKSHKKPPQLHHGHCFRIDSRKCRGKKKKKKKKKKKVSLSALTKKKKKKKKCCISYEKIINFVD